MKEWTVVTFYQFAEIKDPPALKKKLEALCEAQKTCGTILLAQEGINSTMAGSPEAVQAVLSFLKKKLGLEKLICKETKTSAKPFYRMKVRLKKEIVTFGIDGCKPHKKTAVHVSPQDWNELIQDPEVLVIDTRNDYEVDLGSFKGALNPKTRHFKKFVHYVASELKDKKDQKIAMYCTGGIRCEKATSYMLDQGFGQVYQLSGGILKYLEEIPKDKSQWEGECFVFDNRVAVNHDLQKGVYDLCYACRRPVSPEDKLSSQYEVGLSCPACYEETDEKKRASLKERQLQMRLAKERGYEHLGDGNRLEARRARLYG